MIEAGSVVLWEVDFVPGRMTLRRQSAWPFCRPSSLLPSMPVLLFLILMWGLVQTAPRLVSYAGSSFQSALAWGLPSTVAEEDGQPWPGSSEGALWAGAAMAGLTGFDPGYLPGILEHGLPEAAEAAGAVQPGGVTAPAVGAMGTEQPLNGSEPSGSTLDLSQQPVLVAIYHTHNSETYIPWQGQSKVEGQNGGVSVVGDEMVKVLAANGIRTDHDLTIHDYPNFLFSYINSESTAARLVRQNPDLRALLDVHRDAGLPVKETVKVNGVDSARIMIVIGNDNNLPYPHWQWQENYAFAQLVSHRLQELYPGVFKEIMLKDGRYNQHVFPHAILVEDGSDLNTLDEALVAARCFATALADVIKNPGSD